MALFLGFASLAKAAHLELGPMLGHTISSETAIWAKASGPASLSIRYSQKPDLADAKTSAAVDLNEAGSFMGIVRCAELKPSTRYHYQVLLDGKPATVAPHASFVTAPEEGTPTKFRFAFTSCLGREGKLCGASWGEMEVSGKADLILLLGDNHYADSTRRAKQSAAYFDHRSIPAFRTVSSRTPVYGIWDDHDYGPNNSDSTAPGREESLATYKLFWPNPGFGEADNPGIYHKFSRGNVDFFMLDDRYYRSPNQAPADGKKTMLGERQLAWLKRELKASKAPLKFVACGSEFQLNGHEDSWTSFKREQKDFLDFLKNENIEGVILLSGDRHFTGGYQIRGEVIEITSGPMGSKNFPTKNLPEMFLNQGEGRMFSVFDIDATVTPPKATLEVHRAGIGVVERRDLSWAAINGDESLPLLPLPKPVKGPPLVHADHFEEGTDHWTMTDDAAWEIKRKDGGGVLSLHKQSKYKPPHRSPHNIALLDDKLVGSFQLTAKVKTTTRDYGHRSMCLFFGYQDPAHFYYVHLGQKTDDHANQVFIVNEAPRTKISLETTEGTPWDAEKWHDVKIVRNARSGDIAVYFDDMEKPIMRAKDKTFTWGQVGLGSFDDTGDWGDFELRGAVLKKRPKGK